ncbi:MAG: hypothetical protein M3377_08850 [Actinomycetota bacterium]|nr:hypothetical protein [Actinomycetota bacterium]
MRRLGSWLIVVAVGAVALVAAADALFGEKDSPSRAPEQTTSGVLSDAASVAKELRAAGIHGQLVWSTRSCAVRVVNLPELTEAMSPQVRSCRFSVSPGGWLGFAGEVFDAGGDVRAHCRSGKIEIVGRRSAVNAEVRGCAPAWTTDGHLTFVRGGALFSFALCGNGRPCEREFVAPRDLARELAPDPWGLHSPVLEEVAWLRRKLFAAIVNDRGRENTVLALFTGRRLVAALPNPYRSLSRLRVSPFGSYVAARVDDPRGFVLMDATGRQLPLELRGATAITWSPDERWNAVAAADGLYISAAGERATRLIRIPIEASDVFWR